MKKNNSDVRWIVSHVGRAFYFVFFLAGLGFLMSYLSVRFAVASKSVIDIAVGTDGGSLLSCVAVIIALIVSQIIIHIIYTLTEVRLSCVITNSLQRQIFSSVMHGDYINVEKYHSGELINRLTADISVVSDSVMGIIPTSAVLIGQLIFSFTALVRLDMQLALICAAAFPFVTVAGRIYGRRMKPLHKKCMNSAGKIKSHILESVRNIIVFKAFVKEEMSVDRLNALQDENLHLQVKKGVISVFANLLFFAVMSFAYYFALVWCAYKISIGIMTVGTLTAVLQLVGALQEPFGHFSSVISSFYSMTASAERLREIDRLSDNEKKCTTAIADFKSVIVDNVSFSYEGETAVLTNASLVIPRGSLVAIGGASGAGKSTLIKLIMGILNPDSGRIDIDAGKERIPAENCSSGLYAYVPQGNMILSGTVLENIAFFDKNIDRKRAEAAAKNACAMEFISDMPDGMDTVLGEDGTGLSEGQIQRIAIARALYTGRKIILLDEATSALDEDTERRVLTNIYNLSDSTCIIVSHKQCAFDICDISVNLSDGELFT